MASHSTGGIGRLPSAHTRGVCAQCLCRVCVQGVWAGGVGRGVCAGHVCAECMCRGVCAGRVCRASVQGHMCSNVCGGVCARRPVAQPPPDSWALTAPRSQALGPASPFSKAASTAAAVTAQGTSRLAPVYHLLPRCRGWSRLPPAGGFPAPCSSPAPLRAGFGIPSSLSFDAQTPRRGGLPSLFQPGRPRGWVGTPCDNEPGEGRQPLRRSGLLAPPAPLRLSEQVFSLS